MRLSLTGKSHSKAHFLIFEAISSFHLLSQICFATASLFVKRTLPAVPANNCVSSRRAEDAKEAFFSGRPADNGCRAGSGMAARFCVPLSNSFFQRKSIPTNHIAQLFHIRKGLFAQLNLSVRDPAHLNLIVNNQRNRGDVVAVQVCADDSGGNGVAVQADHQVKDCCAVADVNAFL